MCSIFGNENDHVLVLPEDNELLSSLLVTKEDVKQHLLEIKHFKNSRPR